jgi:hypothetical protein
MASRVLPPTVILGSQTLVASGAVVVSGVCLESMDMLIFPVIVPVRLRPNVDVGKRMKKPRDVQEPHNHGDHDDGIQNRFNLSLHWNEAVDQPKQNTYYDQNHQ